MENDVLKLSRETVISISEMMERWKATWGVDPPSRSTVERWRTNGCRGVKLKTMIIQNRRYTSVEEVQRFVVSINGGTIQVEEMTEQKKLRPKRIDAKKLDELKTKYKFD